MGKGDDVSEIPQGEALLEFLRTSRDSNFDESAVLVREVPDTAYLMRRASGYVHSYPGLTTADQVLSVQMRELIALAQLCAKNDGHFAANHVRRLYRLGVTDRVMMEAAESIAPIVGWSTILQVARAIMTAKDPSYPHGQMPPDGPPKDLAWFPELDLGQNRTDADGDVEEGLLAEPEWQYVAALDPELAKRAGAFVDHCLLAQGNDRRGRVLGPGVRELVAIAALCARGEVDLAARHIRRAYAHGLSRKQVLEAISCVLPMTGALTVQIGVRAMQQVDSMRDAETA